LLDEKMDDETAVFEIGVGVDVLWYNCSDFTFVFLKINIV